MTSKNEEYQDYKLAMCAIDSFAKCLTVVPIKSKSESDFLAGLMESLKNLGGKPEVIYADQEPSWTGKYTQQFLKEDDVSLMMTLSRAGIVERAIRTVKDMLHKRLEHDPNRPWYGELLQQVIFVYSYGREHSRIHMTPNEARKQSNEDRVRRSLNKHAVYNRRYPDNKVGDTVRIHKKKHMFDKQQVSVWSKNKYKVEEIIKKKDHFFIKQHGVVADYY